MVPAASALATTLLSSAVFFAMSPHCARGMAQFPIYEYIAGFSLTSDVCAIPTTETVIANVHTATSIRLFMNLSQSRISQDIGGANLRFVLGHASVLLT